MKIEIFVKREGELNLAKKIIGNMLPTKVCNIQKPFYFLVCVICILTYSKSCIGTNLFMFTLYVSKVKLRPS